MRFQADSFSCGAAAVVNALRCHGARVPERRVRAHSATSAEHGTQEHGIKNALERLGFNGTDLKGGKEGVAWSRLSESIGGGLPVILLVDRGQHWMVAAGMLGERVIVVDSQRTASNKSENGVHVYTRKQLARRWGKFQGQRYGIVVSRQ